jgi:RNA-directed DNA polymerase
MCREDVLKAALQQSKQKKGAAGVDGQTFADIEAYGEERWLEELQQQLKERTYRPQAVKRARIPKPGGGERPLGIPTIRDRVAQTAAKLILEPIFEADLRDEAYGYRPGRNAQQAVREAHRQLAQGRAYVIDADLTQYFDTIPHAELMACVARRVADSSVLHLLKLWLKAPVEERDEEGRRWYSGGRRAKKGTPQGGVASPLLANIYLNRLLKKFAASNLGDEYDAKIVAYADDFVVLCRRRPEQVLARLKTWLVTMKLTLNEAKTCIRDARKDTFRFLGYELGPQVNERAGRRYLGARPSKRAATEARGRVSEILWRGRTERWEMIRDELNQYLRGWAVYFAYDSHWPTFKKLDQHVWQRARNFLRRRHKLPPGTARFSYAEVHQDFGVLELKRLLSLNAS